MVRAFSNGKMDGYGLCLCGAMVRPDQDIALRSAIGRLHLKRSVSCSGLVGNDIRFVRAGAPVQLLDTQYRMHPAISQFPAKHFYGSKLKDGAVVKGMGRKRTYHDDEHKPCLGPYVFFDVQTGTEERGQGQR